MTKENRKLGYSSLLVDDLHKELYPSIELYKDGHFDEAVRKASQRFLNRIQEGLGLPRQHGTPLIEKAFSSDNPLLAFNDRETPTERNEHNGFRHLGVGLALGLRNVLSHEDDYGLTATTALEWMAFISAMHRRLDEARQVTAEQPGNNGADD